MRPFLIAYKEPAARLVGSDGSDHDPEGLDEEPEVEAQGPAIHVFQLQAEARIEFDVSNDMED